ncbi:PTS sugar transporter subunit IIA [Salisediminibacterium halotolerans]|uniref:PTS sugar transporter subunit IIA n=1 Tax=Salisediminibacterium halotolerans TaxID=517425 RepID=UPI000EAEA173|nr:PTS glucose transporter subunit IIA [Salisediminibacterium halotolerans]RLJ78013.1 PTS system IIA component (Glc family) [Actinophytocola xinjiangensis]RPE88649.1 PTS system IIA component (Glc family) [Salisediminibacterium halotolerans]TWG36990.1 PTS system IIA component (Glc family) [Salisediminibacterium halotolerans]GEL08475.1 PTS glucose transporter subunit IIA [Salisediminibacterium halotolerans]
MLKKLFGLDKKEEVEMPQADGKDSLASPATGEVVSITEVPDPTFSEKMMGDGLAVKPSEGIISAPVHGEIMQLFPTKHAVGIKTVNGLEVLIHIGIETVNMQGEGFKAFVQEGDKVAKGDKLIEFDMDLVNEKAESTITPMVITNGDIVEQMEKHEGQNAVGGETTVLDVTVKQ